MRVYIASSWKNELDVRALAVCLRHEGYEVDDFTDDSRGRYVFHWSVLGNLDELDAKRFMEDERTKKAFEQDKIMLDWAEVVILLLPAGRSSHLEAGYATGSGKPLLIFSPNGFPKGEFDVMYGFAEILTQDIVEIVTTIKNLAEVTSADSSHS